MSYKTGRVYKIISNQGNEIYIGSTFDQLRSRLFQHKSNYKRWKAGKTSHTASFYLFDTYGIDNCKIILIKEYEVVDRRQLEVYETLWICKLKSINELMPVGLCKFFEKERKKQWYEEHKEELAEKHKQWYEEHKEEKIERVKNWYREHKDEKREYDKQRGGQKVRCEVCDIEIRKDFTAKHERTQTHINNLNKSN